MAENEPWISRIKGKGRRYWYTAVALIAAGLYLETSVLDKHDVFKDWNYYLYEYLFFDTLRPIPVHTQVVLIGDLEHWDAAWGRGRSPTDRNQLAALIRGAYYAGAAAVVVDFDTIRTAPNGAVDPYNDETTNFIATVTEVAKEIPVVLARPIHPVGDGLYEKDQAFFDLPDGTLRDWGETRVFEGYLEELNEIRLIPLKKELVEKGDERAEEKPAVDSLAAAAARARWPEILKEIEGKYREFPFGRFIQREAFHPVSASTVMESCAKSRPNYAKFPDHPCKSLENKVVFIGAGWHRRAFGRGPLIDLHDTPVGALSGVFVVASYLEGIVQRGTFAHLPWIVRIGSEFVALVCVALFLVVPRRKIVRAFVLPIACLLFVTVNIILLHYLGMYCDFVLPLIFIALHPLVAAIFEWRHAALNCDGCPLCIEKDRARPTLFLKWFRLERTKAGEAGVEHEPAEPASTSVGPGTNLADGRRQLLFPIADNLISLSLLVGSSLSRGSLLSRNQVIVSLFRWGARREPEGRPEGSPPAGAAPGGVAEG